MQKTTTSFKKTDFLTDKKNYATDVEMQPSDKTLEKILQFAAAYKVQKLSKNQYVEMILN
jgi:hypothetical protein